MNREERIAWLVAIPIVLLASLLFSLKLLFVLATVGMGRTVYRCMLRRHLRKARTPLTLTVLCGCLSLQAAPWSVRYGGTADDMGFTVTTDANGNEYAAGTFSGSWSFGGNTITSAGGVDMWLAKFDSAGGLQWVHSYGSTGNETPKKILVDSAGNIFVCGSFTGTGNFGGTNATATGSTDGFLARYSPNGTFVWSKTLDATSVLNFNSIALDSAQKNVVACGVFAGTAVFTSTNTFASVNAGNDSWLVKYGTNGFPVWAKTWASIDFDSAVGVYLDGSDNISVVGLFAFQLDFGLGIISAFTGTRDVYLVKFLTSGASPPSTATFSKVYGSYNTTTPFASGMDANGDLLVGGIFATKTDLGAGAIFGGGSSTAFLAKYSGSTGNYIWARMFISSWSSIVYGIAFDPTNNPVIVGGFQGNCNFGGVTLSSASSGLPDAFMAKYDALTGGPHWAQAYGGTGTDNSWGVAVDSSAWATAVGYFQGTGNFDGTSLVSAGAADIFITHTNASQIATNPPPPAPGPGPLLYGLTSAGGANNDGTVFTITNTTFTKLLDFPTDLNQVVPVGDLVQCTNALLYGIAQDGGAFNSGYIFSIDAAGNGFTNLHSFNGSTEGRFPNGTLLLASDGNFYGMCANGGIGAGTIFKMRPDGLFATVHSFGGADGGAPLGTLVQHTNGLLYGMTESGGVNNAGCVFTLSTRGEYRLLYSFSATGTADGRSPTSDLFPATDGNLYGTTSEGGSAAKGTIFKITPTGTLTSLHSFAGASDGDTPLAGLIQASDGNLYGNANFGGANDAGTIFKTTTGGAFTRLYNFSSAGTTDGASVVWHLTEGTNGLLYGMTQMGGALGFGTIFVCSTVGNFTNLHSLSASDGKFPDGGLSTATFPFSALSLTVDSIQNNGASMTLNFGLHGKTNQYYSLQVATDGRTFYQSNYTAQSAWVINMPFDATWAFRLQEIDTTTPPFSSANTNPSSNTNRIYGDSPPDLVSVAASSTTIVTLTWRNNSAFETGFLVEMSTNNSFFNSTFFPAPAVTPAPPQLMMNYPVNFNFAPATVYYLRVYATNANGASLPGPFGSYVSIAPNKNANPSGLFESQTTDVANQIVNTWFSGGGSVNNWLLQLSVGSVTNWVTVAAPVDDPVNGMTFTTNGLTPGLVYYWRVAATNGAGFSDWLTNRVDMPIATVHVPDWYISLSAKTNGSTLAGTNWARAWPDVSSVRWASIQPGDRIWIEQGNYNEFAVIRTPGTGAAVMIHAATNAPAGPGVARFLGAYLFRNNTILDGALNESYSAHLGAIPALFNITNNIGFWFASTNKWINRGVFSGSSSMSNRVLWCGAGPVGVWQPQLGEIDIAAFMWNGTPVTGSECGYCYAQDILGTPFVMVGGSTNFGDVSIHHCVSERAHCNFAVTGYGGDLSYCYLLSSDITPQEIGHPDGYQPSAGWNRVHHNWIKDCYGGRLLYEEMFFTLVPYVLVYDNIWDFDSQPPAEAIDFTTEPVSFGQGAKASMTLSNALIANNTINGLNLSINDRKVQCTNLFIKASLIANNVFAGTQSGFPYISVGLPSNLQDFNTPIYNAADLVFDWNLVENGLINYTTTTSNYTTIANLGGLFSHNVVASPKFASLSDLHPTNAVAGTNLSAWLSVAPDIDKDFDGVTRTAWNMGAYETTRPTAMTNSANLILWYMFSDLSGNLIHDDSYHHAAAFREDIYHWPTNGVGPNTNVTTSGKFFAFKSQNPSFFGEGQYACLTYTNNIDGLAKATFAVWNKNDVSPDGNLSTVHNSVLMAAGGEMDQSIVGDWYWGRWSGDHTQFILRTNVSSTYLSAMDWPDTTVDGSTAWHHLALTYDGTSFIGYFDGHAFKTNSAAGVTALRVGGLGFAALSAWPHAGTAAWNLNGPKTPLFDYSRLDDSYPNAGWLNGSIADMRVYNQALSAAQILALVTNNAVPVVDPQITNQPVAVSTGTNTTPLFSVGATGLTPLSYQWLNNGSPIAGATSSSYITPVTTCPDGGNNYSVIVSDAGGTATSSAARLTITNCPVPIDVVIVIQPADQATTVGGTVTFQVSATGATALHYAWKFNNVSVGTDSPSYTRQNCALGDNNQFAQVTVSDVSGSVPSRLARLVVLGNNRAIAHVKDLRVNTSHLGP